MSNNIDESFVHDTIRKLFIENNIPNSSEDIIYAKYSEDEEISKFFNIPLSEIKSSYNNDYSIKKLQLGRTDIVSRDINTKENNNDTTHGDFIIVYNSPVRENIKKHSQKRTITLNNCLDTGLLKCVNCHFVERLLFYVYQC